MHRARVPLILLFVLACNAGETDSTDDTEVIVDTEDPVDPPDLPDLCINEYMASNVASLIMEDGSAPDWIELHNPTAAAIDLGGWQFSDSEEDAAKHLFTTGLVVPANGFLMIYADSDIDQGPDHLGFNLAKGGEQLLLTSPTGEQELITYGPMASDFSFARSPDCCREADCWIAVSGGSPGATNAP
jgi:hypothetical protein